MEIIAITNQKGGVGKTTTAINLAAALGQVGKKVLLFDLDSQANSTVGLGTEKHNIEVDIFDVIFNDKSIYDAIIETSAENVFLVPSTSQLATTDIQLIQQQKLEEKIFDKPLKELKDDFDYVIMDCPPSLGMVNKNALSSAHKVIIPMQAEYYALEGLTQLLSTISIVKKLNNPDIQIGGILITMYNPRTNLAVEVKEEVQKFFKEKVFEATIPRNIKLAEAPSTGLSIFDYDKTSSGAKTYRKLAKEVLEWGE